MTDTIKKKIIFIEDNIDDYEALTRSIRAYLDRWGIEWINNSKEALAYLKSIGKSDKAVNVLPNLIILDLNMPGIDGRTLLRYIKSDKTLKVIPTIIFSTSVDRSDLEDCYMHGANSYMHKTLPFEKLKEVCMSMMEYWDNVAFYHN